MTGDLDVVRAFANNLYKGAPKNWTQVRARISATLLDGYDALSSRVGDAGIRAGWIVRTDCVLIHWQGSWVVWHDGTPLSGDPWYRLLHAELAVGKDRAWHLDLVEGTAWHCQEVAETLQEGEDMLCAETTHYTMRGDAGLRYRVYWAARPSHGVAGAPISYQPVASRLLANQSTLKPRIDPPWTA